MRRASRSSNLARRISDWHRFAVQRQVSFFRRIEIRKCEQWQSLLVVVRRNHRLEGLGAANANFIVLFELGRRRIFMPTAVVLDQRSIHPIEIAAPRDCCRDCDRVTYLHALRLGIGCHRKTSNCPRETGRRIWWQRLYFKRHRVTVDRDLATFTELRKWVREKWIRKRIVEIEGRPRAWRVSSSWNDYLGLCFYGPDLNFPARAAAIAVLNVTIS